MVYTFKTAVMKKMKRVTAVFILMLFISMNLAGQGNRPSNSLPKPKGWVSDFENILNEAQKRDLTLIIENFEKKTGNEIAVVTVDSIGPYTDFMKYAVDLGSFWGIGKKDKNNGALIVVSKKLRKVRILTGLGTEKILTNEICAQIINQSMVPDFKAGNYYLGIKSGLQDLIRRWMGSQD